MDKSYVTSDDVVYRKVQDETLVVQLESGEIFHFSSETREFLDALKTPCSTVGLPSDHSVRLFFQLLLEKQIIRETNEPGVPLSESIGGGNLSFFRKDDRTIDDVVFLCP